MDRDSLPRHRYLDSLSIFSDIASILLDLTTKWVDSTDEDEVGKIKYELDILKVPTHTKIDKTAAEVRRIFAEHLSPPHLPKAEDTLTDLEQTIKNNLDQQPICINAAFMEPENYRPDASRTPEQSADRVKMPLRSRTISQATQSMNA